MSLDTDSPRPRWSAGPGDTPVIKPGNRKSALPVETETSANVSKADFHGIFMAKLEQIFKTGSFGRFFLLEPGMLPAELARDPFLEMHQNSSKILGGWVEWVS